MLRQRSPAQRARGANDTRHGWRRHLPISALLPVATGFHPGRPHEPGSGGERQQTGGGEKGDRQYGKALRVEPIAEAPSDRAAAERAGQQDGGRHPGLFGHADRRWHSPPRWRNKPARKTPATSRGSVARRRRQATDRRAPAARPFRPTQSPHRRRCRRPHRGLAATPAPGAAGCVDDGAAPSPAARQNPARSFRRVPARGLDRCGSTPSDPTAARQRCRATGAPTVPVPTDRRNPGTTARHSAAEIRMTSCTARNGARKIR